MTKEMEKTKSELPAKIKPKLPTVVVQEMDFGKFYYQIRNNQILAPVKAEITLFEKLGHIYKIWAGKEKVETEDGAEKDQSKFKHIITAAGYVHLNKVPGISILTPQQIIVDGALLPNPHIERNSKTKAIENVNIRKLGIGYSPAGNIVVVDKTLFYNIYTYFIQSIQAKMKKTSWKTKEKMHPNCAMYGIEDEKPTEDGRWAFFPTEHPLGLWINYDDAAIIDCLEEHTQRQRFGDRIAQKIVERNIFKDHPAIGVSQVKAIESKEKGTFASVMVYGYRSEMNPKDLTDIVKQAEQGAATAAFEVQAETIVTAEAEEEKVAMAEVTGDEKGEKPEREPGEDNGNPATDQAPPDSFFEKQGKDKKAK